MSVMAGLVTAMMVLAAAIMALARLISQEVVELFKVSLLVGVSAIFCPKVSH